ncbi:hypothetical protein HB818_08320 [Listeria booriae]|uniref:hypothetical protein n=1 Tax=Listeria booriae TaxID=1552123 RepID=UPI0016248B0C|nr:hypothetical protein [Listeria booriae]MBC1285762.1 hypothetical protein [Listeria booriae]
MQTLLLFIFSGALQIAIFVICSDVIAQRVLTKREILYISILLWLIGIPLLLTVQYFSLIVVIGVLALVFKWKKKTWVQAITISIIPILLMVLGNYIFEFLFIIIFGGSNARYVGDIFYILLSSFLIFILVFGLSHLINKAFQSQIYKNMSKQSGYLLAMLLIITAVTIYIFIYIGATYNFSNDIIVANAYLFVIFILAILMVFSIVYYTSKQQNKVMKQRIELKALADYITSIETISSDMSQFKHDYINILSSLHGYIEQGDTLQLKTYFKNTITPLKTNLTNNQNQLATLQKIDNLTFRATLNTLFTKAKQKRIDLHLEITDHFQMTDEQCTTIEIQLAELINQHQNTKLKLNLTPSGIERMSSE